MGMISKEEALARLAAAWNPTPRPEWVPLGQACGRILAEPALARHSLPVVRAALMDGVALASGEFAHGRPDTASWKEGVQYARADMGDDFDDRFDACIPVEQVTFLEDGGLALAEEAAITPGTGIRERGTTVLEGQLLLSAGLKITPVDLGVLAMGGIESVPVRKRPVVAILPTGSELVPRGSPPARGQTLDSNSIMLEHMLLEMGAETICYPIVKDLTAQIAAMLDCALRVADIVVVNGGSSKGSEDLSTGLLQSRGELLFESVAKVPGRPIGATVAGETLIINLPGPPHAAFTGAHWCLRAAVAAFLGRPPEVPVMVEAVLAAPMRGPVPMEFTGKVAVSKLPDGRLLAEPLSGDLVSLADTMAANGLLISLAGHSGYEAGETVSVELLRNPVDLTMRE